MGTDDGGWLLDTKPGELRWFTRGLNQEQKDEYDYTFGTTAHEGQLPPTGAWRTWLIMAGRGFGKTRAGAEWVRSVAEAEPDARIALVAATLQEARSVMVEGESGLLACCPPHNRPQFEPSLRKITFANGAVARLYGANEPESLRGPQQSHAWCDEIAKWSERTDAPARPGTTCCSGCGSAATSGWSPRPRRGRCRCCAACSTVRT